MRPLDIYSEIKESYHHTSSVRICQEIFACKTLFLSQLGKAPLKKPSQMILLNSQPSNLRHPLPSLLYFDEGAKSM